MELQKKYIYIGGLRYALVAMWISMRTCKEHMTQYTVIETDLPGTHEDRYIVISDNKNKNYIIVIYCSQIKKK